MLSGDSALGGETALSDGLDRDDFLLTLSREMLRLGEDDLELLVKDESLL